MPGILPDTSEKRVKKMAKAESRGPRHMLAGFATICFIGWLVGVFTEGWIGDAWALLALGLLLVGVDMLRQSKPKTAALIWFVIAPAIYVLRTSYTTWHLGVLANVASGTVLILAALVLILIWASGPSEYFHRDRPYPETNYGSEPTALNRYWLGISLMLGMGLGYVIYLIFGPFWGVASGVATVVLANRLPDWAANTRSIH